MYLCPRFYLVKIIRRFKSFIDLWLKQLLDSWLTQKNFLYYTVVMVGEFRTFVFRRFWEYLTSHYRNILALGLGDTAKKCITI